MKRGEIIAELRGLKSDLANVRGWLDTIEGRADRIIDALSAPAESRPVQAEPVSAPTPEPRAQHGLRVEFDGDPVAPSFDSLVTPKQLGMMRALAREAGVDYEAECRDQLNCAPEDLGRRAASAFIDYLKAVQEHGATFQRAS